jgi:hypothetical protein
MTKKEFERQLNDLENPHQCPTCKRKWKYGTWLRRTDPILFDVQYRENEREVNRQ